MAKHARLIDTTPTIRIVNGKVAVFYSPAQLEQIVPVTKRLTPSAGSNLERTSNGFMHKHGQCQD